jgi:hypothetical protein
VGEDTPLVVDHVAVAAAGSLDLFDDPVEPFGAGIGDVLAQCDEDGGLGWFRNSGQRTLICYAALAMFSRYV